MLEKIYNLESEEYICGVMLVKPDEVREIVEVLTADDFFDQRLGILFNAIVGMYKANKAIDIVTVSETLNFEGTLKKVTRNYINDLALSFTTSKQLQQHIKIILKYSKLRQMKMLSQNIDNDIDMGIDIDEVINKAQLDLKKISEKFSKKNFNTLIDGVDIVLDNVNKMFDSENGISGISTGFKSLDRCINGLQPSRLYIVGARARVGKSSFAQQIAEYVALNHNVLFISLEMKSAQYTERSLFRRTGINNELIASRRIDKQVALDRLAEATLELANLKLTINDNSICTLDTLEKNLLSLEREGKKIDLLVIDYAQLMQYPRGLDRFAGASYNSTGLKQLANKFNIPILLLCQLSRAVEQRQDQRPLLSDIKDSGNFEQDADVILFLYREEVSKPTPINKGQAECIVAKNRSGSVRVIPMLFNGAKTEFIEVNK